MFKPMTSCVINLYCSAPPSYDEVVCGPRGKEPVPWKTIAGEFIQWIYITWRTGRGLCQLIKIVGAGGTQTCYHLQMSCQLPHCAMYADFMHFWSLLVAYAGCFQHFATLYDILLYLKQMLLLVMCKKELFALIMQKDSNVYLINSLKIWRSKQGYQSCVFIATWTI